MEPQHYHTAMTLRRRTSSSIRTNGSSPDTYSTPPSTTEISNDPLSSSLPAWFDPTSTELTDAQKQREKQRRPTDIFQLPFEILVGQILAILQLADLARLALVSKAMEQLCQADYLWQRKFIYDFHHRPTRTLRQLGSWKRIYQAMDRVEVYSWGSNSDCRLGYGRTPKKFYESVPKRIRKLDGVGIMELAPTGWGCHALDKNGNVWAWGRIMESNGIRSDAMPRMLKRPRNVVHIAAGRQVVLAIDASGQVWQWCRENKAVEVTFADGRYQHRLHLEHSVQLKEQGPVGYEASTNDGDKFVGIAAGTDYVVAVTSLEKVYVFRRLNSPNYNHAEAIIHLNTLHADTTGQSQNHMEFEDRIVIEPEVEGYKQERVVEMRGRILGAGLHLPIFSEALGHTVTKTYEEQDQWERRQRHCRRQSWHPSAMTEAQQSTTGSSVYQTENSARNSSSRQQHRFSMPSLSALSASPLTTPSSSRPTTLSANFQNFALHHSSGKVLLGRHDVRSDTCPVVLDRLLSNACQVEFGDHHQGLLTEDGQIRTWGAFCEGALGHGDLRAGCAIPTVVEGPLKNRYVIKIGLAGWQSTCLAIDMSDDRLFGGTN
ncbi:hypothetical protein BGZ95_002401, partial [Linnemannia exigua]